ncbi:hypothetical protein KSS87_002190 [Heliosperma pusillum]|nr:hypothetical protein KSS87_002190 [Heliosperma pusillum]
MLNIDKEITDEIWIEILKHLPVKTLGKCRCVCKPWDKLIVSTAFITAHMKYYSQNAANRLLMYRQFSNPPEKQEQYTLFLDSGEVKEGTNLDVHHDFVCPFMATKSGHHFRVVGSVNGLVCLSDDLFGYTYVVLLWNPLIHKYITLPVPLATYQVSVGPYVSMLGFGYDSKTGDHKVVRLIYIRDKNHLDTTPPKVELYSVQEKKMEVGGASWCQVISLDLGSDIGLGWVQCLRNNGEVFGFTKNGSLTSYDPSTKQAKALGFRGRWRSWFTCGFAESLVLLDMKNGVRTHKEGGGGMKKRFSYNIDRSSRAQTIDELEVEVGNGDQEDPIDDNIGLEYETICPKFNMDGLSTTSCKCLHMCATFPVASLSMGKEPEALSEDFDVCNRSSSIATDRKLVSCIKGSRQKNGVPKKKLTVTWAPDVYDPPPTSVSHLPKKKSYQQYSKSYYQRGFMMVETLMKFEGGNIAGDLSEFLSAADVIPWSKYARPDSRSVYQIFQLAARHAPFF